MNEQKIRAYVRKILIEEAEVTVRPGRGGYKKQIQDAGALAKSNPGELMKRLGVSRTSEQTDIERLNSLLSQATSGTDAMSTVYGDPAPRKDTIAGYEGIRIPVKLIPQRDARKYLEHTVIAAHAARFAVFDREIQVEIIGDDILVYFADKPYSWGRKPGQKRKKQPATQGEQPDTSQQADEAMQQEDAELLGEPDLNPDRDDDNESPDEASTAVSLGGGPLTPLGTGPTYPDKPKKKPKTPAEIAGAAFGGAKEPKKRTRSEADKKPKNDRLLGEPDEGDDESMQDEKAFKMIKSLGKMAKFSAGKKFTVPAGPFGTPES